MSSSNNKRSHSSGSSSPQPRKRQLIDAEQEDMDIDGEESKLENKENLENSEQKDGSVSRQGPSLEEERSDLEQAKVMLKRLDYKSAIEVCDKAIELDYATKVSFLLLRSSARARNGDFELAEQDAKAAVNLEKENPFQAYLTSGFTHLRLAMHYFSQAEWSSYNEEDLPDSGPFQETDFQLFETQLRSMGSKEFESSVQTFPQEVLTRMFYFLDSPSLVKVGRVQKEWSRIIPATSSLFLNFEMVGKGESILKGLQFFQSRSNNKIRSVNIGVQDKMPHESKESFVEVITRSSDHLDQLSITHQGDLDQSMVDIAEECSSLKVFESMRMRAKGEKWSSPSQKKLTFKTESKLEVFKWYGRAVGLVCDVDLLGCFSPRCTHVSVISREIPTDFLVKLLSSEGDGSGNLLESVRLPYFEASQVDVIPSMKCEKLKHLWLKSVPKGFLKFLVSPSLSHLHIAVIDPQELSLLSLPSVPERLIIDELVSNSNTASDLRKASSLVKAIKDWDRLQTLEIEYGASSTLLSSTFWNSLLFLLSPFSRENIAANLQSSVPLPNLAYLDIGSSFNPNHSAVIDGRALCSMLQSRLRVSQKASAHSVMSAANGDLNSDEISGETTTLKCCKVRLLSVNTSISCDADTKILLKKIYFGGKYKIVDNSDEF